MPRIIDIESGTIVYSNELGSIIKKLKMKYD